MWNGCRESTRQECPLTVGALGSARDTGPHVPCDMTLTSVTWLQRCLPDSFHIKAPFFPFPLVNILGKVLRGGLSSDLCPPILAPSVDLTTWAFCRRLSVFLVLPTSLTRTLFPHWDQVHLPALLLSLMLCPRCRWGSCGVSRACSEHVLTFWNHTVLQTPPHSLCSNLRNQPLFWGALVSFDGE